MWKISVTQNYLSFLYLFLAEMGGGGLVPGEVRFSWFYEKKAKVHKKTIKIVTSVTTNHLLQLLYNWAFWKYPYSFSFWLFNKSDATLISKCKSLS